MILGLNIAAKIQIKLAAYYMLCKLVKVLTLFFFSIFAALFYKAGMQIHRGLENIKNISNLVLTQGTFDGVHLGHQRVLNRVIQKAKEIGGQSMLLTFFPHPRLVLQQQNNELKLLQTIEEKARTLSQLGIDHFLVIPFTQQLAHMEPIHFVKQILVDTLKVRNMVVGYDHRFGKNRDGDFKLLINMAAKYNFDVEEIKPELINEIAVSSTKIRTGLLNGDISAVNALLGRAFEFTGTVAHGRKLGRTLGFPTANLEILDPYKIIPSTGVYAIQCKLGNITYWGAMNIGNNPTIANKGFSIEVHLLDFEGDLYDTILTIQLVAYLRAERKFENLEQLKQQINADCTQVRLLAK